MEICDGGDTKVMRRARQFVRGARRAFRCFQGKGVCFLSFLILMVVAFIYLNSSGRFPEHFERLAGPVNSFQYSRPNQLGIRCIFPKLDPFAPQIMSMINQTVTRSPPNCSDNANLGLFKEAAFHVKGHLLVRDVEFPEDVKCCFQEVTADGAKAVRINEKCKEIENENQATASQLPTETILVTCNNSKGQIYYKDAFPLFHEKPEVEKRIKSWEKEEPQKMNDDDGRLSVIIIGIDTTSQMQFERGMPLSYKFVNEKLAGVRIMGYNKECVNNLKVTEQHQFHECPLIWKSFASQGYRTSFGEVGLSMFRNHLYRQAFSGTPPTDYHNGPFTILMENFFKAGHYGPCFGPRLAFKTVMDHAQAISNLFRNRRYFNFVWANAFSHTLDKHLWGDKHVLKLLQNLLEGGHLNKTALFLLGDHGFFYNEEVEQAYIESRMPLAYIALPPWFSQRYSKAFQNLQWNAENSVVSPFDMHKTILDMLDLDRFRDEDVRNWRGNCYFHPINPKMIKRGQSLFEVNLKRRNCETAGIPPLYCVCLTTIPLRNDSTLAVTAGQSAINAINEKTEKFPECEKLQLGRILNASILVSNEEMEQKLKADCLPMISNATKTQVSTATVSCKEEFIVKLRFTATPHEPVFQTMIVRLPTGNISSPRELARENLYRILGHCVPPNPAIQPYCICKDV